MRKRIAPIVFIAGGCGLFTEPDTRLASIDRVDVPATIAADVPTTVTIVYGVDDCEHVLSTPMQRTPGSLSVGVIVRDMRRRGMTCTTGWTWRDLTVIIEPPVATPFRLTVRRRQGDTTFTIPPQLDASVSDPPATR